MQTYEINADSGEQKYSQAKLLWRHPRPWEVGFLGPKFHAESIPLSSWALRRLVFALWRKNGPGAIF